MKNNYRKLRYKKWNKIKSAKSIRRKRNRKEYDPNRLKVFYKPNEHIVIEKDPIKAPADFRLLYNTENCLSFFRKIRSPKINRVGNIRFVEIDLQDVNQIDYSTISVIIAINDNLKSKGIILRGNFPKDEDCKNYIIESGMLNQMFDSNGKAFPKSEKSDQLFFEKGFRRLSRKDNIRISQSIQRAVEHLTGTRNHCKPLRTIILEICGNSIEWSDTPRRQWLLGIKYDDNRVIFTVTDVGKGILSTLNKKFRHKISDFFIHSDVEILNRAFEKKYSSKTMEINRNKGLPAIKAGFEEGIIEDLKVITNNVMLHLDNPKQSKTLKKKEKFNGTFYRWTFKKACLNKI